MYKFPVIGFLRVSITLKTNFRIDLRGSDFNDLIGFDKKILKDEFSHGVRTLNLSQETDMLNTHWDLVNDKVMVMTAKFDTVSAHLL